MTQSNNVAIVTGSSSGIGFDVALSLARDGFKTYATMRNLNKSDKIIDKAKSENVSLEIIQLDVTDDDSVNKAINDIVQKEGRIDVLVNNAGYSLMGAAEDLTIEEIKSQFDTNFYGVYRTIQAVLPQMRKQKNGKIINISSISGYAGLPYMSAYTATKFALEGLCASLRTELEPFGIQITSVEPGMTKTDIMDADQLAKITNNASPPYSDMIGMMMEMMPKMMEKASPPSVVSAQVVKAVNAKKLEVRYAAGADSEQLLQARHTKSDAEFEKFVKTFFFKPSIGLMMKFISMKTKKMFKKN